MAGRMGPKIIILFLLFILILCVMALSQETCKTMNELYITSSEINGYEIYLDGNYVGAEGKNGDSLDGNFTVRNIPCWSNHTIVADDGQFTHTLDFYFGGGMPYAIILDDPLFVIGKSKKTESQSETNQQSSSGWIKVGEFEYNPESTKISQDNNKDNSYVDQTSASNLPPSVVNLAPNLQSPQEDGSVVAWIATATDLENDPLYYKFWINGPKTSGNWQVVQDWSTSSSWSWYIQDSDMGSSSVRVWIRDGKHAGTEDTDSFKEYNDYQIKAKQLAQLNVQVTNDVYSENDRHLYYCQDGKYISFKNRIYLIGPDLDKVKSVKYVLHESFQKNPAPDSEDRANNFEMWIMTWGRFPIKAIITTTNGQQFEKDYDLSFKSKVEEAQRRGIPMVKNCDG